MARYLGPVCRLCRREKEKLFLKGNRCVTKCTLEKRNSPPGEQRGRPPRISDYGRQLREKQKLRQMYGILDKQFRSYFRMAEARRGVTWESLLQFLERRLDNVIFHLGLAVSRREARQLIGHGHFRVNNHRVDISSYLVEAGDIIDVREKSRKVIKKVMKITENREIPLWLKLNKAKVTAKVSKIPSQEEISVPVDEQLVIGFCSR
ncbi:30S ribosomal protein S4 [candidate division NPL-UPA2 bacterium Unc8]|uniref:Small ribosomal subunit protein uS4 n=1 Tax=candidate division NPL-UPA2 bacterium Unc8 TaxID=1980939 RepID=A0A399FVW1_UNCN2|nr:30S ribosomal protein S4 [Bacillota bacterium]RII00281.1 MAG: 30S ribosomal protein S4 [candidate division NPL-UPA2 bacterium Unc8]